MYTGGVHHPSGWQRDGSGLGECSPSPPRSPEHNPRPGPKMFNGEDFILVPVTEGNPWGSIVKYKYDYINIKNKFVMWVRDNKVKERRVKLVSEDFAFLYRVT
jgi:hypothetical protein